MTEPNWKDKKPMDQETQLLEPAFPKEKKPRLEDEQNAPISLSQQDLEVEKSKTIGLSKWAEADQHIM